MLKKICMFVFTVLMLVGCTSNTPVSDAKQFKTIYEELNGTIREKDGKTIREITIPEDNPMVISSPEEVLEKISNKDSFIVYFGFPSCPWCRSVLPTFLEQAKEYSIPKVYYVDIENIRDTLALEQKEVIVQETGSDSYYKLLEAFHDVLDDYTLEADDKEIQTGEKRIYAPNFVIVRDGIPTYKIEGQSSKQSDGYMELSDEMIQDMKSQFQEFFNKAQEGESACDTKC